METAHCHMIRCDESLTQQQFDSVTAECPQLRISQVGQKNFANKMAEFF